MTAAPPACPLCGTEMNQGTGRTPDGLVPLWMCPDRTCTGIVHHDHARPAVTSELGASLAELMRAPVTPKGGGQGGSTGRRTEKPGERQWREERRRARGLDVAQPIGPRDREEEDLKVMVSFRATERQDELIEVLAIRYGDRSNVIRVALDALEAIEAAREEGSSDA